MKQEIEYRVITGGVICGRYSDIKEARAEARRQARLEESPTYVETWKLERVSRWDPVT